MKFHQQGKRHGGSLNQSPIIARDSPLVRVGMGVGVGTLVAVREGGMVAVGEVGGVFVATAVDVGGGVPVVSFVAVAVTDSSVTCKPATAVVTETGVSTMSGWQAARTNPTMTKLNHINCRLIIDLLIYNLRHIGQRLLSR